LYGPEREEGATASMEPTHAHPEEHRAEEHEHRPRRRRDAHVEYLEERMRSLRDALRAAHQSLGAAAHGLSGTWRDLVEDVNQLAGNLTASLQSYLPRAPDAASRAAARLLR
jgi:hypothetical protein